jgi:polyisoprenoid-binding protein YceI
MSATHLTYDAQQFAGTRWRLDPSDSTAEFCVPNVWGLASVKGRFERIEGWLEIDDEAQWHMVLIIDADSLDTGNARRDKHLRSAAFFDVENHPVVRFRSLSVTDRGDGRLAVAGELEAGGEQVALPLDVTVAQAGGRLELDTAASIDQRDLDMRFSPLRVIGTPTALTVHASLQPEA